MAKRKPNFFDLLVLLLVLAALGVWYYVSHTSAGTVETVEVTYIVELNSLDPGMGSLIQAGDTWKESTKNYEVGAVAQVEIGPQRTLMTDFETGAFHYTELPNKERAVVTMTCQAQEDDREFVLGGGYTLRAGSTMVISGPGYKLYATVLQILREGSN